VVENGETITNGFNYTQYGDGVQDLSGKLLASVENMSVENNSGQGLANRFIQYGAGRTLEYEANGRAIEVE